MKGQSSVKSEKARGLTHKAGGKVDVGADLAVNLNRTLHHDLGDLIAREGVLESVSQHDDQRK